ncbi:MAG TPA: HAD-IB family hydrolase, partial [Actinocrinis sp.]
TAFLRDPGLAPHRLLCAAARIGPLPAARLAAALLRGEPTDGDIRCAYRAALRLWAGESEDELARHAERVFSGQLAARLRPGAWSLVKAHQRRGHIVAIVTAAARWQVAPMAARLGVEHVLCGEPQIEEGRLTGALPEPILRGGAKAAAVLDFARAHGIDPAASHAYADSIDDLPFLESVGAPCALCPSTALAAAARARGWDVLRLDRRGAVGPVTAARSAAVWSGILTGIGAGLGLAAVGMDRREAAELGTAVASRAALELGGVQVRVQGGAHLAVRPAVFLFNHQSWLDGAVLARLLGRDYTGFAKAELARVPGLGRFGRLLDVVFVDRGADGAADCFRPALDLLARGVSLAVAPEGTRSATPAPGPFHKGAFLIARAARVPVVPVVIRNTGRLMPRTARTVRAGRIDVVVHPPLDVAAWRIAELGDRIEDVRRLYVDTLMTGRAGEGVAAVR